MTSHVFNNRNIVMSYFIVGAAGIECEFAERCLEQFADELCISVVKAHASVAVPTVLRALAELLAAVLLTFCGKTLGYLLSDHLTAWSSVYDVVPSLIVWATKYRVSSVEQSVISMKFCAIVNKND